MRARSLCLVLLPLAQCPGEAQVDAVPAAPVVPASIRWTPEPVIEGTLFVIHIEGGEPAVASAQGTFGGQPIHFFTTTDGRLQALAAAPLDSAGPRTLTLELTHAGGSQDVRTAVIEIAPGRFEMQHLRVAPEFGRPQPPEIQRRIAEEAERAREVSRRSHDTPRLWEPPFTAPRPSRVTSGFGHGRKFNDQIQSRHTGTDFAGAVGAPVRAPARGRVALADDFFLAGRVIYLDHGAGLVTGYLHLSDQLVRDGDLVEPGQLIGRVGATGRVTGPHLHWVVRYGPHPVDGLSLLALFASPDP
jgi:murein DD-endopeptidase MepM/ murein hydrolase activator NlpD